MPRCVNIPVFIPHLGCPNDCVFCNQRTISGTEEFHADALDGLVNEALSTLNKSDRVQIAFFGGSFTGIGEEKMVALLEAAYRYVRLGAVESIRLSTRPDYIDEHVLDILSKYGVSTVELGIQSMDDGVLELCRRGHTSSDTEKACALIKEYGFELVGQMMIGLPGATPESERLTAERICEMGADAARVYPTVVFRNTKLCEMAEQGKYAIPEKDDIIARTADVLDIFDANDVVCIRVGLCASENLASDELVYGGANDSAIGEMAMGEVFLRRTLAVIGNESVKGKNLSLYVPQGCTSRAVGHRGKNKAVLQREYGVKKIKIFESMELSGYRVRIDIND